MVLAHDKRLHFAVGALVAMLGSLAFSDLLVGFLLACLAGIGKELYDKISEKGTPEVMDVVWTTVGGLIGVILVGLAMSGALDV